MPIHTKVPIRVLDQEAFHQVDRCVTGLAFAIHNELGRFLDEGLYQGELTRRCRENGFEVEPELQITVSYGTFSKNYFADHLINQGTIVEDKAVSALNPAHKGQALNYLFLCGLHHATLLNFRTERVQHEFVSTRLTPAKRRRYQVVTSQWQPLTPRCRELHDLLQQLLTEWGAYLDPVLYRDAFMHFLGDDIAFSVTASTHRPGTVLEHQRRFLRHTPLLFIF